MEKTEKLSKILQNKILLTATIVVSIIILLIIVGLLKNQPKTAFQGQAETTDYRVSTKVPSRVVRLFVREGQYVHSGDTLVLLASPEIDAERQKATAAYESAKALEELTHIGNREEAIRSAYEHWQQAKTATDLAEKTFRRIDKLHEEGVTTAQKHDEALSKLDAAVAAEKAARAMYEMAKSGSRNEEKRASHAQSNIAKAAIETVNALAKETILTASADGIVTEIFPEEGELIGLGAPIMNIATNDWWFTFNIRENELPGIEMGKEMKVFIPARDVEIPVRISLIKNVGNFAAWKATRALEGTDLKVFEVQARPIKPVRHLEEGMSAMLSH
ncbi:MAG: efflux RND transporter periplasmic adaptor subunit [Prevotella sp.]|nr:efflux RND transporter periplasmic adaptor subunit [Prevotella sp.]